MKERRIKLTKLIALGVLAEHWEFVTVGAAAKRLDVHEKYVPDLVRQGRLERVVLTDLDGLVIGTGISLRSIGAFKKHVRKTKQLDLLPDQA